MVRKKRAAPPPPNLIDTHRPALPSPPSSLLCEPQEENQNKQQEHQQTADFCKQMSVNFTEKLSDDPFYLFGQTDEDDRCLSNSSPSQDSGVPSDSELSNLTSNRDEKSRSRDSSVSKRSSIASQDSLELPSGIAPPPPQGTVIPPAPPLDQMISLTIYNNGDQQPTNPVPKKFSQKDLIVTAKNTLKRRNSPPIKKSSNSDFQFYVNEGNSNLGSDTGSDLDSISLASEEDFAGSKTPSISEGNLTIRSHRGTVRGVKNRVRAGIATFLRDPSSKDFEDREQGQVVIYFTTLGVVRETWARCVKIRQILRNLLIKVEERDVFMCRENQIEVMERLNTLEVSLPHVFVDGHHIGNAETVEKLNETGELRQLLRPYKNLSVTSVCGNCGGFRMLPCPVCNGSKKSMHRNDFTAQFVALRCTHCDECGLVKCDFC